VPQSDAEKQMQFQLTQTGPSKTVPDWVHEKITQIFKESPDVRNVDIARRFGLDAVTVGNIKTGKRQLPKTYREKPQRCPTCGGLVFMPCVMCRIDREQDDKETRSL